MESDVIIIGAGVLGVSLAFHLGNQGTRVILLERETTPAVHSSGNNAGMIRHLYRHPQLTEWTKRSVALWPDEIRSKYFRKTGSIIAGRTAPFHHTELFSEANYIQRSEAEMREIPAVYTPDDGLLDSGGYVNALYRMTNKNFVTGFFNTAVSSVQRCSGYWEVQTADGRMFYAPWLVNAAGAWLNSFVQPHYPWLCVNAKPYARHLFVIHGWEENFMPAANCGFFWDEAGGWYLRLWENDSRLVSICDKVPVEDPNKFTPPAETADQLAVTLLRALPDVAEKLSLGQSWHCFRTYTDDMLPMFGEDRDVSGLFWFAAFGGFGMSTSFAAALDAASIICGERIEITADFSPERAKTTPMPQRLKASVAAGHHKTNASADRTRVIL
ncbi:MAG TPA: FAD-dependent oxidoreductase [Oligoflexia bacterium]|nr:FAD-dependent oxidoreductase [Oligoflexia bacterium]